VLLFLPIPLSVLRVLVDCERLRAEEGAFFRCGGSAVLTNLLSIYVHTVHGALSANTFAVYGAGQNKELTELVPGILNQLGPDSLASLRKLAESYQAIQQQGTARAGAGGAAGGADDDDDVPDLVESFDVPDAPAGDKEEEKAEEKKVGLEEMD
jgi:hypothetical protein